MNSSIFKGRKAIIVTKHGKEKAISPVLLGSIGLNCVSFTEFDTDTLGTFTGEHSRQNDVQEVLRQKCMAGLNATNYEIAIASEGSFFTHPQIWIRQCNEERLMIIDKKNDIEITAITHSFDTNHAQKTINNWSDLLYFAQKAGFPQHALILRPGTSDYKGQVKGIRKEEILKNTFHHLYDLHGAVHVETDMRAMFNPSRMKVIEIAARKLSDKILSLCPACQWPGFDVIAHKMGLPCSECDYPTQSLFALTYQCIKCKYEEERLYPKGKTKEDPQYCDQCNP